MSANPNVNVRVTRSFTAPAEAVFDAWLDPGMIGKWMFGPALRDEEVVRIELEASVGSTFSFVVRRAGQEIDHVGTYLQIDRPRHLAFTWGIAGESDGDDTSRVIIDILPVETGCELTLTHELHPDWADYADRTAEAWTKMLNALAATL